MGLPKVSIAFGNGNLLQDIAALDGITGIVVADAVKAPTQVFNLADAVTKGITVDDFPALYRHVKEFYDEIGGNQELWVQGVVNTMTMAEIVTNTNEDGAKLLVNAAEGKIRILAVGRVPDEDYEPGANFLDADVSDAVIVAKIFAEARLTELRPLRIIIEGRVNDAESATIYQPTTGANGFAAVVLGGSANDGSASIGTVLGRAAKYGAHIKLGKVANGALALTAAYIGATAIKDVTNLEVLHDKGYITFMNHPMKAGFYIGKDFMASTDDYRRLTNGRIVDKAAVIATQVFIEQLQGEVLIDSATGKIAEIDIHHLKGRIESAILVNMAGQISSVDAYINPDQNIVSTETLALKLSVTPLGYTTTIEVEIGLNAGS